MKSIGLPVFKYRLIVRLKVYYACICRTRMYIMMMDFENHYLGIITSLSIIDDICETITIISMTKAVFGNRLQLFCKESNRSIIYLKCEISAV